MSGTYLTRSTTTRTNDRKFTFSCWFKKSTIGTDEYFVINYENANNRGYIANGNNDKFIIYDKAGGTERLQAESNFVIRDTNAWYHLVYAVDSTASSNRVKFYINGVDRYSDFTVATDMAQNVEVGFQKGNITNGFKIGSQESGIVNYNGLMSHVNFVDGLQLDASAFGETDSTTGEWKIKTSPTVSEYGNNGFFILKDSGSKTDQSGKGNNFSEEGTPGIVSDTQDSPSNVFATMNPLDNYYFGGTFTNGNNKVASVSSVECYWTSTLGASSGKYYWEVKIDSSGSGKDMVGIADKVSTASDFTPYSGNTKVRSYYGSNGYSQQGGTGTAFGATFGTGDIISVAMDLDNNKLYFGKNGTWQGSGNPTTGANGLAIDTSPASGFYYAQAANIHNTASTFSTNFGNGYFGTTAVSSAGTNASGNGIFEYDVPTGYTALSTKGLNL